ncbi:hypothetical protein ACUXST_002566, partial [Sphingomonas sp. F9_3S_D5_B_2]
AGEVRYEFENSSTTQSTMVFADTDGDGAADFAIRIIGDVDLSSGDFLF